MEPWQQYLLNLQESDPKAYEALVRDLEHEYNPKIEKTDSQTNQTTTFNPVLPGGKSYLGSDGIKILKETVSVIPKPCFALKTKELNGTPAYINICTSKAIGGLFNNDAGLKLGSADAIVLAPVHLEKTSGDQTCKVFDVIVNPDDIEKLRSIRKAADESIEDAAKGRRIVKQFYELIKSKIESIHKCSIDSNFKGTKVRYMGNRNDINSIEVEKETPQFVEELNPAAEEIKSSTSRASINFTLSRHNPDGSVVKLNPGLKEPELPPDDGESQANKDKESVAPCSLILSASLPILCGKNESHGASKMPLIEVAPEFLRISSPENYEDLELFLPEVVRVKESSSKFDVGTGLLEVQMPIETNKEIANPWWSTQEPDPGSEAWKLLQKAKSEPEKPEVKQPKARKDRFNLDKMIDPSIIK